LDRRLGGPQNFVINVIMAERIKVFGSQTLNTLGKELWVRERTEL
jgi:hypothetical protein